MFTNSLLLWLLLATNALFASTKNETMALVIHAKVGIFSTYTKTSTLTLIDVSPSVSFTFGMDAGGSMDIEDLVSQWKGVKEVEMVFADEDFNHLNLELKNPDFDAPRQLLTFDVASPKELPEETLYEPVIYFFQ